MYASKEFSFLVYEFLIKNRQGLDMELNELSTLYNEIVYVYFLIGMTNIQTVVFNKTILELGLVSRCKNDVLVFYYQFRAILSDDF